MKRFIICILLVVGLIWAGDWTFDRLTEVKDHVLAEIDGISQLVERGEMQAAWERASALQQDWEAAFRGAHTLKGVAQNLGFERLYQVSAVLTEAMRGNKPLEDRSLLDAVEQQDAAIRRAISELE